MSFPLPNPDQRTITGRAQHVINTLCRIERILPLGECNGRWQQDFANAIALLGKPIEDYTLGELLSVAYHHNEHWLENEHYQQAEQQHLIDTGGMEYTR